MLFLQTISKNLEKIGEKPVELTIVSKIEEDIARQEKIVNLYLTFKEGISSSTFIRIQVIIKLISDN